MTLLYLQQQRKNSQTSFSFRKQLFCFIHNLIHNQTQEQKPKLAYPDYLLLYNIKRTKTLQKSRVFVVCQKKLDLCMQAINILCVCVCVFAQFTF